jgi:hypothetical protein
MATTGELSAIMQELHMIEVGDAASYLGEEAIVVDESPASVQAIVFLVTEDTYIATCDGNSCQALLV